MVESQFDFIVVGSGLAGLSFALEASQKGSVCILTKNALTESNTSWAQGGIAAAIGEADSWESHERDTLVAGDGLCNPDSVRFLVQQAPESIHWLESWGAKFDQNSSGRHELGREGGHSQSRIVHHRDRTGWEVERAVSEAISENRNISLFEHAFASSLVLNNGRCVGVDAEIEGLGVRRFLGRAVFLATGGCGKLYTHTTNPNLATGDGIALASDAGAKISGMEFMQFHPTTLYHPQHRSFLISEAVRGAGGTLKNHLGRRFMYDYDDRLELAPRDVVARAIDSEMKKHDTWCVYLDTTHLNPTELQVEFPTIYERLDSIGIRMERDWIPVVPAQHYSCGGIVTDLNGQTTLAGLYASGECASTGVHGANRLASNSLLEALVFGRAAARAVSQEPKLSINGEITEATHSHSIAEADAIRIRRKLQRIMTKNAGIVRTTAGIQEALRDVRKLIKEYNGKPSAPFSAYSLETRNLLIAGQHVLTGASHRHANVGLHFNQDFAPRPIIELEKVKV